LKIRVECYSGYRADESPRRLLIGERDVRVEEIVDRWAGEGHRYFKVLGDDRCTYLIRHDEENDAWDLVQFEADAFDLSTKE
jgi:hypothetical protein